MARKDDIPKAVTVAPRTRPAKTKAAANSLAVTAAVTAGLVLLNAAATRVRTRFDLTSAGLYSLTPASKKMIRDLKETVQVTAYFGHVPDDQYYMQEFVESMLEEYASTSGGKLEWHKVDPFAEGREYMQKLETEEGIQKIFLLTTVDDAPKQEPVYFHVQFKYLDKKEVWAPRGNFSLAGIEYTFSALIRQVGFPRKKIAVTEGSGEPAQAQAIHAFLQDLYDVSQLDLSQEKADLSPYDIVIVNGPAKALPQTALMQLDQHVMAGKPVLFLLRGMAWQSGGDPNMPPEMQQGDQPFIGAPVDDGLAPLLSTWGIEAGADVIIDGRNATTGLIPMGREPLPTKIFFPNTEVLPDAAEVLPGLEVVPVPFASTLKLVGPLAGGSTTDVKVMPLLRSYPTSFRRAELVPVTRETSLSPTAGDRGPYGVAYALEGSFRSYLAGDEGANEGSAPIDTPARQSPAKTRLAFVGSADIVGDPYMQLAMRHPLFQPLGTGRLVLADLIDWLAQDQTLLAARSKEAPRPIEPLGRSDRLLLQYGNLAGAPLLLCLAGLIAWRIRERRRRNVTL